MYECPDDLMPPLISQPRDNMPRSWPLERVRGYRSVRPARMGDNPSQLPFYSALLQQSSPQWQAAYYTANPSYATPPVALPPASPVDVSACVLAFGAACGLTPPGSIIGTTQSGATPVTVSIPGTAPVGVSTTAPAQQAAPTTAVSTSVGSGAAAGAGTVLVDTASSLAGQLGVPTWALWAGAAAVLFLVVRR